MSFNETGSGGKLVDQIFTFVNRRMILWLTAGLFSTKEQPILTTAAGLTDFLNGPMTLHNEK